MKVRRLSSKEDEERKRKRNMYIVGGILIFVLLFSTLGYSLQSGGSTDNGSNTDTSIKVNYKGYEFNYQNNYWVLQLGDLVFGFAYNPQQTEDGTTLENISSISKYSGQPLYISSVSPSAEQEVYRNLDQIVLRRQYACLEGENCTGDYPTKTCEDNFIIIKQDIVNSIVEEDNCVYIIGKYEDLPKLTDEFLFKIMGIQ